MAKQTFYFDIKDGVTVRDRIGMQFDLNSEAIEHSRQMANRFRHEHKHDESDLAISVINESGEEIHREFLRPIAAPRGGSTPRSF